MTILNFSHIGISCENPLLIEKFYTKYFGFKRARVYAPGPDQVVMIKASTLYLELFKSSETSPVKPLAGAGQEYPGWRHICFMVENLDETLKELCDVVEISLGPVDMSGLIPKMRVVWVKDPEGNIIELNEGYVDEDHPVPLEEDFDL